MTHLRQGSGGQAARDDITGWVREIGDRWAEAQRAAVEVGRALLEAKDALPHGRFETMVGGQLPFGPRTAEMLMAVARDARLARPAVQRRLPASWRTLYALTRLPDDAFDAALESGAIHPDMERREAETIAAGLRRRRRLADIADQATAEASAAQCGAEDERAAGEAGSAGAGGAAGAHEREAAPGVQPVPGLRAWAAGRRWPVIVADPPWRYETPAMGRTDRSIENHYPTMTLEAVLALPVAEVATDPALLVLWLTAPQALRAGPAVLEAWGFEPVSQLVWIKPRAGMGYWCRNRHELAVIARRGDFPVPAPADRIDSVIEAPAVFDDEGRPTRPARGRHSEKPDAVQAWLEAAYPELPMLELFARRERPGWSAWGNEYAALQRPGVLPRHAVVAPHRSDWDPAAGGEGPSPDGAAREREGAEA